MKRRYLNVMWCAVVVFLCSLVLGSLGYAQEAGPTPQNPLTINAKEKSVSVLAEVNGKHLVQPTRHGAIFKGGKFGDKAVFTAFADPKAFYEALMGLGFKAGNNMTMENKEKTSVEGDPLDVTVTWKGAPKVYRLDEVIKDSNGKPFAIRFGGNLATALKMNTGCLLCLDSCPVGITSNAAYTYGAVEGRKEVAFVGNKDILPPDRTQVVLTFKKATK
jgi:hypothetical protein